MCVIDNSTENDSGNSTADSNRGFGNKKNLLKDGALNLNC